ncbi:MAG TPA: TolC family protein [Flavobacteriales bacterium]|nr:TolC family protein [Flavobacteriales bacterium]
MQRRFAVILGLLLSGAPSQAQDTLHLTFRQADSLLVNRSLALVVKQADIDRAEAGRVQARLFQNPQFSSSWVVGGDRPPYLDIGPQGEQVVAVEKLFRIAGQRSLAMRAAEQRQRVDEAEYAELAAALKRQLHRALVQQYYARRSVAAISSQLELLDKLQGAYGQQYEEGNVSLKEATRLRTAFFALNDQRINLLRQLNELQQQLRDLLGETATVQAAPTQAELGLPPAIPLPDDTLIALAQRQRHAAMAAGEAEEAAATSLKLERRMAVPDLAIGAEYDQWGNLHPKQTSVTLGFSIPLFDRNQGGIKRAEADHRQAQAERRRTQLSVRNQVLLALDNIRVLREQYDATSPGLYEQLDQLSEALVGNYVKNNLKLLEFTDLFESYNTTIIALNQLKADLHGAYDELEFAIGQDLFGK